MIYFVLLNSCRFIFILNFCLERYWHGWFGVHLSLFKLDSIQSLSLNNVKKLMVSFLEHGLDLVQALLHCLQILHHHTEGISFWILVQCCGVKGILLDNLMKEKEGIFVLTKSLIADSSLECCICKLKEFCFEGRSPGNAVLLFLLDILNVHVCGIIKKRYKSLHHLLAEFSWIKATFTRNIKVNKALGAVCLPSFLVEEFLK